ncbi:MAG TPA: flagellar biosynthesis protein FlhA [Pirellulales bacterium]
MSSPGTNPGTGTDRVLARLTTLILPAGLVASLLVILVPMPPALMDLLLSVNIAVAVVMLLTTVYVRSPLEFSVFPSLLLATTLGRLVLNIATTRLILTRADSYGLDAAGGVVRSFGEFVAGDRIAVGLIIFLIIIVIQFVVITKGATRISEVAARFALDGMPGRQMAIDADLTAGLIDQKQAQRRRADVARQADFFGAMDGASKFVRGDAVAGIVIILVNIVGGLFVGVVESGMNVVEAASIFSKLTIGDGLVTQVPALLISLAAALLVTRSSEESDLPAQFVGQLFSRPEVLLVTAGFLGLLTFTSLPFLPLLAIAGGASALAYVLTRNRRRETEAAAVQQAAEVKKVEPRVEQYLAIDPLEIEIGIGLIRLADSKRGGDLLPRVQQVRQRVAAEIGIVLPKVRIRDNTRLDQNQYRIKLADMAVADGHIRPTQLLAIETASVLEPIPGAATPSTAFERPGVWIEAGQRRQAESQGYAVHDPTGVLTAHLSAVVHKHAEELLTRDATRHLLDELRATSPAVVDELVPGVMKLAEVQQVLHLLLREGLPIRNLGSILESLGDHASRTSDPQTLAEHARQKLSRTICTRYRDSERRLHVLALDAAIEDRIRAACENTDGGQLIRLSPVAVERLCQQIDEHLESLTREHHPPVLLVSPQIRAAVKEITSARLPHLVVLSFNEITTDTRVDCVAVVGDAVAVAA